ncbi:arylesterase [Geoalkalibacter halelectricus]|uniref:Arylesterase n=1 Tax=Geoalkalibacter halelectricus TaxID=2847045 RepID=A0ABY5ZPA2_9BACT|nr:arylesterase [Geoalkalibacter halelectricus]MDO3379137.1 arylesterase [Geoalkalibacter halelectricus]UWZ80898.1 arylesterase [Geoalkalibacter halelectricus]
MKKYLSLICVVFLFSFLAACDRTPRLSPLGEGAVILAFGDSITYGTGAGPGESYPEVLERLTGFRVVNAGVPGELSAAGVERLPGVLAEVQPDLVILCHGGNDVIQRLSPQDIEANIRAMVALAREAGAQVLLIGVPQPSLILQSIPLYERISWDMGVPIDKHVLPDVLRRQETKGDEIHPNAQGYAKMAETLAKLIR